MQLDAIIFDLDNTLLDRPTAQLAWSQQYASNFHNNSDSSEISQTVERLLSIDALGYTDRREFAERVLSEFPPGSRQLQSVDDFLAEYRRQLISLYPRNNDVCEMVRRLRLTFRLAVVSNGRLSSQLPKMKQAGLSDVAGDMFEAIVISEAVRFSKPHPDPFHSALEQLGVEANRALYIGDNPYHDVAGAANLGMRTCWVSMGRDFPGDLPHPDIVVESVLEVDGALDMN